MLSNHIPNLITQKRLVSWHRYHEKLESLESDGVLCRPVVPSNCQHNAHMYYVLLAPEINRQDVLDEFKSNFIYSVFHYVPLHSSPVGMRYGRAHGALDVTNKISGELIRLPLWVCITEEQQDRVVDVLSKAIKL